MTQTTLSHSQMNFYYDLSSRDAMKIQLYLSLTKISVVTFTQSSTVQGKYRNVSHTLSTNYGDLKDPFAIIKFIARETAHIENSENGHLYGDNNYEKSLVDQWIQYFTRELTPVLETLYEAVLGKKMISKRRYHEVTYAVQRVLETVDQKLKLENFVCGNFMSLVDICLAADLQMAYKLIFTEKYRRMFPYLTRWYENISKNEDFQLVYGIDWVCQKEIMPDAFLPEEIEVFDPLLPIGDVPPTVVPAPQAVVPSEIVEIVKQTKVPRNHLGYIYLKKLLKGPLKQKKQRMSMMWPTLDLLNCTFWKIKYLRAVSKLKREQITEKVDILIDKCDTNDETDDYGVTVVKKYLGIRMIMSAFCFVGRTLPKWMQDVQQEGDYEIVGLEPVRKEADRQFLEDIWNSFTGKLLEEKEKIQNQKVQTQKEKVENSTSQVEIKKEIDEKGELVIEEKQHNEQNLHNEQKEQNQQTEQIEQKEQREQIEQKEDKEHNQHNELNQHNESHEHVEEQQHSDQFIFRLTK